MSITEKQKIVIAAHLGISLDKLTETINNKVTNIIETKVAKWKSEGKTGITKAIFDKTVNDAVDEILDELRGPLQ